ncbi:Usp family protein [Natronobeatus ordinarius]|uniref:Usp family protein n=1 Tax=Natronobeatus ordinarius TaxID=2963433 RepID=UPI0020CC1902|nr:Usp family protein [Natronobeatus ordinarius]
MTVVALVDRSRGEEVVLEAARQAEELETELHVVFVLGLGKLANMELGFSERLGIPTGTDVIEDQCTRIADEVAGTVLEEEAYEAVGLVGVEADELLEYAEAVEADCIVVDGRPGVRTDTFSPFQNTMKALEESEFPIVPVY